MLGNSLLALNQAQIYIGDLDSRSKEIDLYNLLNPFGEVSMIKLIRNRSVQSAFSAFIAFKDPLCSNKARRELNGIKFLNRYIRVCRITKDRDPQANIFIKNIPSNATLKDLEEKFSVFGSVVSSKIAYDSNGISLKYGFLQYERKDKALEAIKQMNGITWDDSVLSVCEFLPISSRNADTSNNLYIKGFPLNFSQDDIKRIFSVFGEISSIGLMTAKTKEGEKAFGFVNFINAEAAEAACNELHMKKTEDFEWYVVQHMNKNVRKAVLRDQYRKQIEE